jgi:hypothetical protein
MSIGSLKRLETWEQAKTEQGLIETENDADLEIRE